MTFDTSPFSSLKLTRRELAALGSASLITVLSGCTTTGGNSIKVAGAFRYPLTAKPTTLDPGTVQDGDTIDLLQNIFEGLVSWNEKSEVVPAVAEKWEISGEGRTYTFHLRHGVKFHNGREVKADDFKYSMDRSCDPAINSETVYEYMNDIVGALDCRSGKSKGISGVTVLDPYTLQISIDKPKSYFLDKLTYPTFYAVCREAIAKSGGKLDASSAVGCGPFKLASPGDYQSDYRVVLTVFQDYHAGKPELTHIVRPVLLDASTRLSQYEAGELDLVGIASSDLDHVNSDPKLKADLHTFDRARIWYLTLNQAAPGSPFANKIVRVAFNMAVNKQELARIALNNLMPAANSIVPPGMGGYVSTCKPIPYNPAQARTLLKQAGYGSGGKPFPSIALIFRNDTVEAGNAAQVISNQIKINLGISIPVQSMELGQFINQSDQKTMPFSLASWGADYLDPQDFLSVLLHTSKKINGVEDHISNNSGYSSPAFDSLCDRADIEQNQQKRFALYQQAEQIAINDAPWVPLYFQRDLELIKPNVKGIRDSLLGHLPHTATSV